MASQPPTGQPIAGQPMAGKHIAYDRFQAALLSGALRPGQFFSQRTLVEMLGLSIGALRELLPRLETEGLLSVMPQRGIQITAIDLPMIRNAFQLRVALEREAVIACVTHMSDGAIAAQHVLHRDLLAKWQVKPVDAFLAQWRQIDTAFHQTLIDTTRNDLLIRSNGVNTIRICLIRRERGPPPTTDLEAAMRGHLRVIDAIAARDRTSAVALIEDHIHRSFQNAIGP